MNVTYKPNFLLPPTFTLRGFSSVFRCWLTADLRNRPLSRRFTCYISWPATVWHPVCVVGCDSATLRSLMHGTEGRRRLGKILVQPRPTFHSQFTLQILHYTTVFDFALRFHLHPRTPDKTRPDAYFPTLLQPGNLKISPLPAAGLAFPPTLL